MSSNQTVLINLKCTPFTVYLKSVDIKTDKREVRMELRNDVFML
jgi:hypothetical protein